MFLWKACNNILPTKENLFKRGIVDDHLCLICGLQTKIVGHILWSCQSARDVWFGNLKMIQKSPSNEYALLNIIEFLMGRLR
jgi:hypothetical protein